MQRSLWPAAGDGGAPTSPPGPILRTLPTGEFAGHLLLLRPYPPGPSLLIALLSGDGSAKGDAFPGADSSILFDSDVSSPPRLAHPAIGLVLLPGHSLPASPLTTLALGLHPPTRALLDVPLWTPSFNYQGAPG